jgi:hypothetical protein
VLALRGQGGNRLLGQGLVRVMVDGMTVVSDSWAIRCHLDDAYPRCRR